MKSKLSFFMLLVMLSIGLIIAGYTRHAFPAPELPKEMITTALPMPSSGYTYSLAMGDAIKEKLGVRVRVITGGSEVARILPLRTKEAHFSAVVGYSAFFLSHGWYDYSAEEWGPQPLRCVWQGITGSAMVTRGNAGIKTMAELKGKRIIDVAGNLGFNIANRGFLAFGGLTEKDVRIVIAPSSTAAWGHVIEGTGDSFNIMPDAPKAFELEASRHGIYWIPTPKANVEAWKRLWKWCPFYSPYLQRDGAGISKDKPLELASMPYITVAYSNLPNEYAYAWTKGAWEGREMWVGKHPTLKWWTYDLCIDYKRLSYPYHDGTVKFFKEVGVWTPAMEKWQQNQVRLEAARLAAWGEAKKEAGKNNIKVGTSEFSEFWIKWQKEHEFISYPVIED
jgi:TRAP transporter TAXI family solute receptor